MAPHHASATTSAAGPIGRDPMIGGLPAGLAAKLPAGAELLGRAPGRGNLMGEHTDYNDGFVLPVALGMTIVVAGRPTGGKIRLRSIGAREEAVVDPTDGSGPTTGWGRYVAAVVRVLIDEGIAIRSIEGVIASDLPSGSGLASSAALEVAVAMALLDEPMDPIRLARLCQRAENVHVGVQCGIMDQMASVASHAGTALLLDCRSFAMDHVPVPDGLELLIVDSGQRRSLDDGDYNRRRAECEEAARLLGVSSLREVENVEDLATLPPPLNARARHVLTENQRTLATANALRRDDRAALGAVFAASHASLATDFEVSTPALDTLVELAAAIDGVVGTRMTGAGFGGCTINLVDADLPDGEVAGLVARYGQRTGLSARTWRSAPSPGAFELRDARAT
jgi:galactokinase